MKRTLCDLFAVVSILNASVCSTGAVEAEPGGPADRKPQLLPPRNMLMVPGFLRPLYQQPGPLSIDAGKCRLPAWLDDPDLATRWFAPPSFASQIPWNRGRRYLYPNPGFEVQVHKRWVFELSLLPKVSFNAYVAESPFAPYVPEVGTAPGSPGPAPEILNPFTGVSCWFREDLLRLLPNTSDRELIFPY
jgi:hypothetical protein